MLQNKSSQNFIWDNMWSENLSLFSMIILNIYICPDSLLHQDSHIHKLADPP